MHHSPVRSGHFGDPGFLVPDRRPGGNIAEIFFNFFFGGLEVDISGETNHDVRWTVIRLEPFLHVVHRCGIEVRHIADDGPRVGMPGGISVLRDELKGNGVGLVFSLALFVLHNPALQVERLLIELAEQEAHAVGFHPERVIERGSRHVFKVVGAVIVGGAVEVGGADFFHGVNVAALRVLAAAKHQVFEEMRESGFAGPFVFRADVIPEIHRDYGSFVVFVDDERQPIIEREFFERDVNVLREKAARCKRANESQHSCSKPHR